MIAFERKHRRNGLRHSDVLQRIGTEQAARWHKTTHEIFDIIDCTSLLDRAAQAVIQMNAFVGTLCTQL